MNSFRKPGPLIQLSRELLPCELEMFSIALQHWVNKYTFVTQQLGMMVMTWLKNGSSRIFCCCWKQPNYKHKHPSREVFSSIYSKAYCCLSEMRDSRLEYTFGTWYEIGWVLIFSQSSFLDIFNSNLSKYDPLVWSYS